MSQYTLQKKNRPWVNLVQRSQFAHPWINSQWFLKYQWALHSKNWVQNLTLKRCSVRIHCMSELNNKYVCVHGKSFQLYSTLCDPVDCRLLGYPVHGILQARILVWVATPPFRGSSWPRDQTRLSCPLHWQSVSLPLAPPGKPNNKYNKCLNRDSQISLSLFQHKCSLLCKQ